MEPERWERVKEIFDAAADLTSDERREVLASCCGTDRELRAEVERLLVECDRAGDFLDTPAMDAGKSLVAGDVVDERYEIAGLLGRGGMGEVYEARDRLLNEAIALKTLRPELSRDRAMLVRFQKEILAARRVTHPNVCRVFEVGLHGGGLHYFTMELLAGETLAARIAREGCLAADSALPIIRQMAQGLQAAHQAGVVHRDFKSANVMLAGDRAVITDFGLARATYGAAMAAGAGGADTAVSVGQMAGTVGYMSPEQLTGAAVTAASDIYSFGIVLFEMAAGKLPFDGTHVINSAVQRVSGQVPWIRNSAPDIDAQWESAIQRCLQPLPEKRFASAGEIVDHFDRRQMPKLQLRPMRRTWLSLTAAAAVAAAALVLWPVRYYSPKQDALPWYEKGVEAALAMTYDSGRKALEKAVSLDPEYAPAHAYLAAALSELDNQSGAKEEMLKALAAAQKIRLSADDELRVRALQHMTARQFDAALPLFTQLVSGARTERERAAGHLQLAWLEQKRQNLPETQKSLQEALRLNSSHAGAKLRLAMIYAQKPDMGKATAAFDEAEALFRAASDMEGVTEVLWQQARFLARSNRTAESLQLAGRGLTIAASTGDRFHEIRLQLVQALAYRNVGEVDRSKEIAERAVLMAVESKMDATAAVGLLDLGNAYVQRDEPAPAERYFKEGLQTARNGHADFSEARASLALGSLYVQYNRPVEAMPQIERALPYFRDGGHKRESMQGLLLLGAARTRLAQYDAAERTLRDAVKLGEELRDRENHGLARSYLGGMLAQTGRWPEAITESTRALELFGDLRGGYRAAHTLGSRARVLTQLGRFDEARADIVEASKWAERAEGNQAQVKARLALTEAEIGYIHGRCVETAALARKAGAMHGGAEEDWRASFLTALCAARSGSPTQARALIADAERSGNSYRAALGRLEFAEATGIAAEAAVALLFFEPQRNWEATWRCRRAMGGGVEHGPAQKTALDELRRTWPANSLAAYFARPDLKKFGVQ